MRDISLSSTTAPQEIRFCRSFDGVKLAYARHGGGPPLVIATCWFSHLEYDWQSPVWRHFVEDLGTISSTVRYDERGFGLSDWDVEDFSFEARVADLEAVVDDAGLKRFALLGMAQGGPVSIAYALRHPERVSRLILHGAYAAELSSPTQKARDLTETFIQMIQVGWARPESEFRRVFTSIMIPDASEEQMAWLDALQRMCTSTENAVQSQRQRIDDDVTPMLAELDLPTLVLHARGDRMVGFEDGRKLASSIRGARLVALDSRHHILLGDEPAWPTFLREVSMFLRADAGEPLQGSSREMLDSLTSRECDVLALVAEGKDNLTIAGELSLSTRTVERHLQNIYLKLGLSGKAARAGAVAKALKAN